MHQNIARLACKVEQQGKEFWFCSRNGNWSMPTTIEAPIKNNMHHPQYAGTNREQYICMHTYTSGAIKWTSNCLPPSSLSLSGFWKTHASTIALWFCSMSYNCTLTAPLTTASPSSSPSRAWSWPWWRWCSCKRARRRRRRRGRQLRRKTTPSFTPTWTSLPCLKVIPKLIVIVHKLKMIVRGAPHQIFLIISKRNYVHW